MNNIEAETAEFINKVVMAYNETKTEGRMVIGVSVDKNLLIDVGRNRYVNHLNLTEELPLDWTQLVSATIRPDSLREAGCLELCDILLDNGIKVESFMYNDGKATLLIDNKVLT